MGAYQDARDMNCATLGEAADMRKRSPKAFAAGAQYALDRLLCNNTDILECFSADLLKIIEGSAAELLTQARTGDL